MNDDSSDERQNGDGKPGPAPRGTREPQVEMTFYTTFQRRELVRDIRDVQGRSLKSLLNEALDLLIAKHSNGARKPPP